MKLSQLFSIYPQLKWGDFPLEEVSSICIDSRKVEEKCVFVAIKGHNSDGHQFIPQACAQGAIGLVVEDEAMVPQDFKGAVVKVESTQQSLHKLAAHFYNNPAKDLFCVGVTGTNGKTSFTYILEHLLNAFGLKTGVLGTIDHHIGEMVWESQLTTPGPVDLQKRLREFVELGAKATVFEVSSHALEQKRVYSIPFDVVVFTNLTRDHLDYHETMEDYFKAKEKLFKELPLLNTDKKMTAVVNKDDEYGRQINFADNLKSLFYGLEGSDYNFKVISSDMNGTAIHLTTPRGEDEIYVPMPGLHNVYNSVAAIAAAIQAGASLDICKQALKNFKGIPGRLQKVENNKGIHVFVDYAHTSDALENVVLSLKKLRDESSPQGRVMTVFGCGGDRDKGKRPLMMSAASQSDYVFVTSDNPRTEDPEQIISDIIELVSSDRINNNVFTEADRKKAIYQALEKASDGDIVLIAGKGHEDYQILGTEKIDFSDFHIVEEFFSGN